MRNNLVAALERLPPTPEVLDRLIKLRGLIARGQQREVDPIVHEELERSREICKTLKGFIAESWHVLEPGVPYVHCWHHDALSEVLEAVTSGDRQARRVQINQPPGTMKSLIASVMWEAYEWTKFPHLRYLTTSYKEDYARRDSRRMRDLVQSEWYQSRWPNVKLLRDGEGSFENTQRGARAAMPFASLTGGRGNRVVIDDPHSTEEVESDADREKARRIFRESVPSRVNDPEIDAILVIMHRLHPEDLCGLIEELGLPYTKVVLPMEYVRSLMVPNSYFVDPRTKDGELLCPHRVSPETIAANKIELGPHAYDTQYQQMARAREGSYFFAEQQLLETVIVDGQETFEPVNYPAHCDCVFAIVDTASKTEKKHDATGVVYFALSSLGVKRLTILDYDASQIEARLLTKWIPTVFARLEELAVQCGARRGSIGAFVEDKDSGVVLLQHMAADNKPAHPIPSEITAAGKEGRAMSVSGYVNKGMVRISRFARDKVITLKGKSRNHLLYQVTGYRIGIGTPSDEDELFDCTCYGIAIAFGNDKGY